MLKKNLINYIFNYYLEEKIIFKAFIDNKLNTYDEELKELKILEEQLRIFLEEQTTTSSEEQTTTSSEEQTTISSEEQTTISSEEQTTTSSEETYVYTPIIAERLYQHLDKFKETNFLDEFEFFLENELKTSYIVLDDGGLILSEDDFLVDMFCLSNIDQFSQNIVLGDIFCLFQSYYFFFNLKCEEFRFLKKYNKRKVKKKLRMKRLKRVRKFRIFKKLLKRKKTIIKLKKFRPQSCITYKKTKKSKPIHLFQKLTLTPRMIQNVNLFFFYKLNSHALDDFNEFTNNLEEHSTGVDDFKKFKIMLRNYHRKPYWKLRTARITHWTLFFKNTIRQTRYKSFITRYIKNLGIYKLNVSNLFNYFTHFKVSWTRISLLDNLLKNSLICKLSDHIFSLPLLGNKLIKWKFLKKKNFRQIKKMGKWSYLGFKRFTYPWLQKKKNFPKLIKHLQPRLSLFKQLTQYDLFTNYIFFIKKTLKFNVPVTEELKNNFFIKSHMFRYNASSIC